MSSNETAAEPEALSSGRAWAVTLVATLTMALSYVDRQVLAVLAPTVQRELALGDAQYGWLQSAFSLAYLAAAPIAGRLLERFGIRRGMLVAVLLWSAVSAMHAGMSGFFVLFTLRILLGVTESPSFPGSASAIARVQSPEARPRALGVLYTGSSLGAMIAPPLATALAASFLGWRGAFVGVAALGLLWVPLWLYVTGDPRVARALEVKAGPRGPSLFEVARHPAVMRASALVAASSPIFAFILLWSSKVLVEVHGVAQTDVGTYLPLAPLLFDVGAILFGHAASVYAKRRGAERTPTALALLAGALALVVMVLPWAPGAWAYVILAGLALAGGAGLFAMLTGDMVNRVGPGLAATAGGVTAAVQSILYVIANPLFGYAREALDGYAVIQVALGLWLVPGLLFWLAFRPALTASSR